MISLKLPQPAYLPNTALHIFKCQEYIPLDKDILWQIDTGVVRTSTWDQEGNFITLSFWGAGDVIGQPLSRIKPYQLECMTEVKAYALPSDSQIANRALISHVQQTEELLRMMHCKSVENRLLKFLIWSADKFGEETSRGKLVKLRLTHQEVADMIGTTRVTVTRLLGKFEREGIVSWSKQRCILLGQCVPS